MMIVCLLDGVIKRPIGYSGGRRPGRQADRRPRADEASRFLAFISHTSINFHWRTTRNRESNGDHLARSCSVVSWHHQGYSRATARIDVHLETSPAIRLDATYRGAGQQYCMSMGRAGYWPHAAGPAWWAAPRAARCTRPRCPGARTAWRARWAAACSRAAACPARPPAPASLCGRCTGIDRRPLGNWKNHNIHFKSLLYAKSLFIWDFVT